MNPVSAPSASNARIEAHVLPTTEIRVSIPSSSADAAATLRMMVFRGICEESRLFARERAAFQARDLRPCRAAKAQQAAANTKAEFNKAFGACLEGKGDSVK